MQGLYAPWRDDYIKGGGSKSGCVFCDESANPSMDDKNFVFYRDESCFCVMNRYPYGPGHFLIIPHEHQSALELLDPAVWVQMTRLSQLGVAALKETFGAAGVNIGMNIGEVAGAGIAEHLHLHVLPRWNRDTNFITTLADTRVYSTNFEEIFEKLKSGFLKRV